MNKKILRSFPPVVDKRSRILILGTMPGPMALAKREYYGFTGNHFWKIMFELFGKQTRPYSYAQKIALLKRNRIALWDVFKSCRRLGAADHKIESAELNDIPGLLKKFPNIKTVFVDSLTAKKVYEKYFAPFVKLPMHSLPSPSPAYAAMPLTQKIRSWSRIKAFL